MESNAKRERKRRQSMIEADQKGLVAVEADMPADSVSTKFPKEDKSLLMQMLRERKTWLNLIATGGGWFIYDVAYCKLVFWCVFASCI